VNFSLNSPLGNIRYNIVFVCVPTINYDIPKIKYQNDPDGIVTTSHRAGISKLKINSGGKERIQNTENRIRTPPQRAAGQGFKIWCGTRGKGEKGEPAE
jgi:hypothetical protein